MANTKPDKELKRLQHELEKERQLHLETQKKLQITNNQLDTIDRRTEDMERVKEENKGLTAKLASYEDSRADYMEGVLEGVMKILVDRAEEQKQFLQKANESKPGKSSYYIDEAQKIIYEKQIEDDHQAYMKMNSDLARLTKGFEDLLQREADQQKEMDDRDSIIAKAHKELVNQKKVMTEQKKKLEDKDTIISKFTKRIKELQEAAATSKPMTAIDQSPKICADCTIVKEKYSKLVVEWNEREQEYSKLAGEQSNTFSNLKDDYTKDMNTLMDKHEDMVKAYNEGKECYNALGTKHNDLVDKYNNLAAKYTSLLENKKTAERAIAENVSLHQIIATFKSSYEKVSTSSTAGLEGKE